MRNYLHYLLAIVFSCTLFINIVQATSTNNNVNSILGVYAENRDLGIPNYVTEDLLLASYGLIRKSTMTNYEVDVIYPSFNKFIEQLYQLNISTYTEAGKANHDYLAVLHALLTGSTEVGHAGNTLRAQQELNLVYQSAGISASPLWHYSVDYSQYKPRGKYVESKILEQYFRAYRYASSILFAAQASKSTGVTKALANRMSVQAKYLSRVISSIKPLNRTYHSIIKYFDWQFGQGKDISVDDIVKVLQKKSENKSLSNRILSYAKKHQLQPSVNDGIVNLQNLEKGLSIADVRSGFRLFPSRETSTAKIFQQFVYPNVNKYKATCKKCSLPFSATAINGVNVKGFPTANELMAVLGSQHAKANIANSNDTDYKGYKEAVKKAYTIAKSGLNMDGAHYDLMRNHLKDNTNTNTKIEIRHLNSMKGFWVWQQYLSLLYTKQSYTLTGKGMSFADRSGAWLEPATNLYSDLNDIVNQHIINTPHPVWNEFSKIIKRCLDISLHIDKSNSLSNKQEGFLNNIDKKILALSGVVDHPIVVDVHTNPSSKEVLQEGLAAKLTLYKTSSNKVAARGALFRHYEFKQPMSNRLTDNGWLEKLKTEFDIGSDVVEPVKPEVKLDGSIRKIFAAFNKGGIDAYIDYVKEHNVALENNQLPVKITLIDKNKTLSIVKMIEDNKGQVNSRIDNVQFALVSPSLLNKLIKHVNVWTVALSLQTTNPINNVNK